MTLLRSLMLASAAALGLLLPVSGQSEAQAGSGVQQAKARYNLYYRGCAQDPWSLYGTYRNYDHCVQHKLAVEAQGYEAYIY